MTRLFAALAALAALASPLHAAVELVMVEEAGCPYCARWNADVAPEYGKTAEGRAAPLRRVEIGDIPDDLELVSRPVLTPTFILVEDGVELRRMEGYPGEDFFWGLLGRMLAEEGIAVQDDGD